MKRFCLFALALAFLAVSAGAFTGSYPKMQVRMAWPSEAQFSTLQTIPDLDPMKSVPGEEIILVSNPEQVERLRAMGFDLEVMIEDMEEHYASQRRDAMNFGDLYTYSEMIAYLDEFHAQYPDITTEKFSIGTTIEGNTIWAIKVSDNPGVDEDEPEVLFDALHHAREPITVNVVIETIRTLCENYGTDPEITFLVDNRETFFVPVINVDGYLYNEQTYPGGGGMWRKNRRDNEGSSCYGVDPNRNYPYEWGGVGSSADPCDETYRGEYGGSEPCVAALMDFINDHEFVTHDSYHSVVGIILIPWCYTSAHTPDDALFRVIGAGMAEFNGYTVGQGSEILYSCSGTTTDWAYGEQTTKPKIFSVCTEVDGSGFWPNDSEVPGLVSENIGPNLYLMKIAGCYLDVADAALSGGNGDGKPDPGETLDLTVTIANQGVIADAEDVSVMLSTRDAYVQLHDASSALGGIEAGGEADNAGNPFSFSVDPSCPAGHKLTVAVEVTATAFAMTYDVDWLVGDLPVIFADDMESGAGDWTHEVVTGGFVDEWHLDTYRNHTSGGATSWKFGGTGAADYASLADGALVTPPMTVGALAQLSFWHWMDAEESGYYQGRAYDGGLIEMSLDGGPFTAVEPLEGYTHTIRTGGTPGPFPEGTPVFSGAFDWREDVVRLEGAPGEVQFRFRFGSDGADTREGWYVDDVAVVGTTDDNLPPTTPVLVSPLDGETVYTSVPTLTVENATDPDAGTTLTYGFRVFGNALLTNLVTSVDGVAEGTTQTSWTVSPSLTNGRYYWDAYAFDGIERGPCMAAGQFTVDASQDITDARGLTGLRLFGARPNPAPGSAMLRFSLGQGGDVWAEIFDLQGRRVRRLTGRFTSGAQGFNWDGLTDEGRAVPAGVYLYTLGSQGTETSGRLMLVR